MMCRGDSVGTMTEAGKGKRYDTRGLVTISGVVSKTCFSAYLDVHDDDASGHAVLTGTSGMHALRRLAIPSRIASCGFRWNRKADAIVHPYRSVPNADSDECRDDVFHEKLYDADLCRGVSLDDAVIVFFRQPCRA